MNGAEGDFFTQASRGRVRSVRTSRKGRVFEVLGCRIDEKVDVFGGDDVINFKIFAIAGRRLITKTQSPRQLPDWPEWTHRLTLALFFPVLNWLLLAPASTFREVRKFLPHQDKIAHATLFLVLVFLVRWSLPAGAGRGWRRLGIFATLILYAGAIEALQPVLGGAGRQFDWWDMACNIAGVCAGWVLFGVACATRLKQAGEPPVIKRACGKTAV